jgi:hypothetical protein
LRRDIETVVNNLGYGFGALTALCAIVAGVYAYRASTPEPEAAWDYDPSFSPRNFEQHAFGMMHAIERALMLTGRLGKRAAFWGGRFSQSWACSRDSGLDAKLRMPPA